MGAGPSVPFGRCSTSPCSCVSYFWSVVFYLFVVRWIVREVGKLGQIFTIRWRQQRDARVRQRELRCQPGLQINLFIFVFLAKVLVEVSMINRVHFYIWVSLWNKLVNCFFYGLPRVFGSIFFDKILFLRIPT